MIIYTEVLDENSHLLSDLQGKPLGLKLGQVGPNKFSGLGPSLYPKGSIHTPERLNWSLRTEYPTTVTCM